ncbi:hypothetical protein PFX98_09630 [Paucibacter sediminis]|uniref:Uncharacterized protein n=1 Tax=Paucibacter sediminis TaxID=3019553 RepID=A0AA95NJX4_9BURK|nr:hypothetical protein [Paucibacter sp. S2-9]WIT13863.1 hypothetical protein PFX98_09630 [Paucibacter sp. S2-9]
MPDADAQAAPSFDATGFVVRALVLYALAEHQAGHANEIRVIAQGYDFSVSDDGRGHSINKEVDGSPYLNFIYGQLDYPFATNRGGAIQLQGIGMSLLNSLCSDLAVEVRKSEQVLRLLFRTGQLAEKQVQTVHSAQTGNTVSGIVAPQLARLPINEALLESWLCRVAATSPSLRLSFNGRALHSGS